MGRVGFRGRTRRYAFLLVGARSGAGVDGATPRRRPASAISGGFPWQFRHRVPDLSAYATKMGRSLVPANRHRVRCASGSAPDSPCGPSIASKQEGQGRVSFQKNRYHILNPLSHSKGV
jgi:hypothetical protein